MDSTTIHKGARKKKKTSKINVPAMARPSGVGKFRSATDVMNLLPWDGGMDASSSIVGFEDRLTRAQEKALA